MVVSAVIPNRNKADLLRRALGSLRAQRLPPGAELEVLVVDNGSTDGSQAAAAEYGARTIQMGANRGVGWALNRGIAASRGEWLALVNNDVELAPDWLDCLLAGARRGSAWFATGRVYDAVRRELLDGAGDAVCRGGAAWRLGHGKPDGPVFARPRATYFPAATAALFRNAFFERAGGFDEEIFAYLEDVDLGLRAARLGLAGVYVPEARAWHVGSATAGRWSAPSVAWITRHQVLLLAKHYSGPMLLRFAGPIVAAQLLWALLALSRGRSRAWLRGMRQGLGDCWSRRSAAPGRGGERVAAALRAGEAEIARIQAAVGWDTYWKWYFRLARPTLARPT